MLSVGLDLHKRYSQVEAIDEAGQRRAAARLGNVVSELERFFGSLGEPCCVVLEAGWNWGLMHDWLEGIEGVVEVQLAHPYGVRAIAAAQVKTDRIDARTLAQLLRADLIPRAYVPSRPTRGLRETVRQRLFLVRLRTMIKNRIHGLLDRYHVKAPPVTDLFGKAGRGYLEKVELPGNAQDLLSQDLRLLESLTQEIRHTEALLASCVRDDRRVGNWGQSCTMVPPAKHLQRDTSAMVRNAARFGAKMRTDKSLRKLAGDLIDELRTP